MEQVAERVYGQATNQAVLDWVDTRHGRILDVGCGVGTHAEVLSASGKIVDGITLSNEEQRLASAVCRRVAIYDLEQGLPRTLAGPYDLCLCSHVIEHLRDPSALLNDIHRVLAPDGKLLVALPNLLHYHHRWQLLRGRFEYTSGGIMDSTHVRWYTWKTGGELLESHGYEIERRAADGGFPLSKLRALLGPSLVASLDRWAVKYLPAALVHSIEYWWNDNNKTVSGSRQSAPAYRTNSRGDSV